MNITKFTLNQQDVRVQEKVCLQLKFHLKITVEELQTKMGVERKLCKSFNVKF